MSRKVISPFDGDPKTKVTQTKNGEPAFRVEARELTARGARAAETLSTLCTVAIWVLSFMYLLGLQTDLPVVWAIGLIAPIFTKRPFKRVISGMLRKTTVVMFTPTEFKVRSGWGWKKYDRTIAHSFELLPHDKLENEARREELRIRTAAQHGQVIGRDYYYTDSFHVSFIYLKRRHDVLEVYEKPRALAVLARFQACDEVMDAHAGMGNGQPLSPDDEWEDQPGNLPKSA